MDPWDNSPGIKELIASDGKEPRAQGHSPLSKQAPFIAVGVSCSHSVEKLTSQLQPLARPEEVKTKEVFSLVIFLSTRKISVREPQLCWAQVRSKMDSYGFAKRSLPIIWVQVVGDLRVHGIINVRSEGKQAAIEHRDGRIRSKRLKCDERTGGCPHQRVGVNEVPASHRREEFPETQGRFVEEVHVCVQSLHLKRIVVCVKRMLPSCNRKIL